MSPEVARPCTTPASIPELELLRLMVKRDAPALRRALSDHSLDFAAFLRFAHRHQLSAFAYWTLKQLALTDVAPRPMLAAAKAASLRERETGTRLEAELQRLADLFAHGEVGVLFIKGPLFARRFYGSTESRAVFDLDILVKSPADLRRVEALLLGIGYEPAFQIPLSRRLTRRFAHHLEYRRDALPLDIHWALQSHFTFAIDYDRIWATAVDVELNGRSYRSTSDEYELVLQILGILTDLEVGKLTLRSLVDVFFVLRRLDESIDWVEFFTTRRRERIHRPSVYVLRLVLGILDCHDSFPRLRRVLDPVRNEANVTQKLVDAVLKSRPMDARQKLLALRIYEAPLALSLAWWLVSLPFRMAVFGIRVRVPDS